MDNRKPPDTNVVRLRRNGDPSDEERQRLASTIFAEQDEVGTFSRGNLVPPAQSAPPARDEPAPADPFFEQLQAPREGSRVDAAAVAIERDATDAYFESLGSQTPAEMTESVPPQPVAVTMPGSANLPGELIAPRRRRSRGLGAVGPRSRRAFPLPRIRVAARPVFGAVGALIIAGVALVAIVGGGGNHTLAAKHPATKQASAFLSHYAALTNPAQLEAALVRSNVRRRTATRRIPRKDHRHGTPKTRIVLAADRKAASTASSSSATVTPVDQASTQSSQPSTITQQPVTPAAVAETTSGSGSSTSSSASHRPAFGEDGTLGPGHSPNG